MDEEQKKTQRANTFHHIENRVWYLVLGVMTAIAILSVFLIINGYIHRNDDTVVQNNDYNTFHEMQPEQEADQLSPAILNEKILQPALVYQPGTAGASLKAAYAAAMTLHFITDCHIHREDQDYVNQSMAEAFALLTEEEQAQLKEILPNLMALIDETIEIYPENRGLYDDTGSVNLIDDAMSNEDLGEDWSRMETALETIIK